MFGGIKKAILLVRLLWAADKGYRKGRKQGKEFLMDKPLMKSKTVWGSIITAVVLILTAVGGYLGDEITLVKMITQIGIGIGQLVAIIGGRDILGKLLEKLGFVKSLLESAAGASDGKASGYGKGVRHG